ncbi:MAG: hypothetical protein Q8K63_16010 [Acidimicrobiales bacterium]|nr:hypothetical protein [Acidimicrobiales bacterium]
MTLIHPRSRRVMRAMARIGFAGSGLALAALAMELPARLVPAHAAGTNAGDAQVVNPATGVPLGTGTKDTDFTLRLPTGASCTGDSANDGYRVQSYHVPASVDPSTLTFNADGPVPNGTGASFRQPLYGTNGSAFVEAQTAPANPAPGPGQVINLPAFDFGQYDATLLPAGTYNVGIACTRPGGPSATQNDKYWNVQFSFAADLSWTASQAAVTTTTTVAGGTTSTTLSTSTTVTTGGSTTSTTQATASSTTSTSQASGATTTTSTTRVTTTPTTASVAAGSLARAGSDALPLGMAGFSLIVFGRMAYLLGRPALKGTQGK